MKSRLSLILPGCLLFMATGCTALTIPKWNRTDFIKADEEHPAAEIVCVWKPARGTGLDGMPTRGFAGQILFFNRKDAEPVVVEGDVRVFLFDDVGTLDEQSKPIHKFDFKGDAWNLHAKQTTLGPSYHVFIPYTRKDFGYRTNCALRLKLTPKNGPAIYSNVAKVPLPGPERPEKNLAEATNLSGNRMLSPSLQRDTGLFASRQSGQGTNVNADLQYPADPSFQSRRDKMQHLQNMVQDYMHSQKKPARSGRAANPLQQPEQQHVLSQTSPLSGHSVTDSSTDYQQASRYGSMTPQTLDSVQPIETTVHPLESAGLPGSNEVSPQTLQILGDRKTSTPATHVHPLESGYEQQSVNPSYAAEKNHPLLPAAGSAPPRDHSYAPNQHPLSTQQIDRLPPARTLRPSRGSASNASRLHPLEQPQRHHPLEGFSSQTDPSGSNRRLKPTVSANAAPLSRLDAVDGRLQTVSGAPVPMQHFSVDRRVSLLGR